MYKFVGDPKNPHRVAATGADRLNKTKDGLQGSESWTLGADRLERALGGDVALNVRRSVNFGRIETWVVTTRPDGSTVVQVLDTSGRPKNVDLSKIIVPKANLTGAKE